MGKWTRRAFISAGVLAGGVVVFGIAIRPGDPHVVQPAHALTEGPPPRPVEAGDAVHDPIVGDEAQLRPGDELVAEGAQRARFAGVAEPGQAFLSLGTAGTIGTTIVKKDLDFM